MDEVLHIASLQLIAGRWKGRHLVGHSPKGAPKKYWRATRRRVLKGDNKISIEITVEWED
jgi:hypothetical protein